MLRIDLPRARAGMTLALPVHHPQSPSRVLLKRNYNLTDDILSRLSESGIKTLWVNYPSLDFLADILDPEAQRKQAALVHVISETFERLQHEASAKLPYDRYTKAISDLVDHAISHPKAAIFLGDLTDSQDELMRHGAAVAYLSILMGMKIESYIVKQRPHVDPARAKDLTNLGLGAMLHDIGVTQLADDVREQYRARGDESDSEWQEHPAIGFRMVRGQIDPSAATIVLNHHQRFDGQGYCGKDLPVLQGPSIHIFARIVAVADAFDRLCHPAGLPPQPTVWALAAMMTKQMHKRFDPVVLSALMLVVPPYPPGSLVQLSDNRWAVVIDHNPDHPCRPVLQIVPDPDALAESEDAPPGQRLDLATTSPGLCVTQWQGHDVSELNYPPPRFANEVAAW